MQKAMEDRRGKDTHGGEQHHSRIERIEGSKYFSRRGLQGGDRTHAAKDHGGVEQGIQPGETFKEVVAKHAHEKREGQQQQTEYSIKSDAFGEYRFPGKRLFMMFVHEFLSIIP